MIATLPADAWGKNPTLLACGHLAEPMAGYGVKDGARIRQCWRCKTWEQVIIVAADIDLTGQDDA